MSFICSNITEIVKEEEFSQLNKDVLVELLKSEHLQIDNEFQVFQATMSWIFHDVSSRRKHVFDILAPVRFPTISTSCLNKYINECNDLSLKVALSKIIKDFVKNHHSISTAKLKEEKPHLFVPRKGARKRIFVVGGYKREVGGRWNDSQALATVECFNTFHQTWETCESLRYPRSGHGVCVRKGFVYAVGGENDSLIYDSVEAFEADSKTVVLRASMTKPRCGLGVCVVDDEIYAIGGWVGSDIGNSVEKFDVCNNLWTEIDTVNTVRFAMGVTEYEGNIVNVTLTI